MNNPGQRRALLTGATGYIGSQLARRLVADGWEVHVIVRATSNLDVLQPLLPSMRVHQFGGTTQEMLDIVAAAAPDTVFHLASLFLAQHRPDDIVALINSNLLFSTQLAEAMVANGVRLLVNTGTAWQHHGDAAVNPVNLYAATKQAFEDVLAYYVEAHGLKVTTLALFDTYGPRDPRAKLIALLWKTAASQQQLQMSPGEQMIDLVHIDDVLNAFVMAATALRHQESGHARYGVSSGKPLRLKDVVSVFERATGTQLPIVWGGRAYRPREVMVPWTRSVPVPGWRPEVELEAGIVETAPRAE
jgi:nucleoside-diphosphate-sugar epimerase